MGISQERILVLTSKHIFSFKKKSKFDFNGRDEEANAHFIGHGYYSE